MNLIKLPINEKMIVSKYLNKYDFEKFVNTFKLNNMYFTSFNCINLNLCQKYNIDNILFKYNQLIKLLPNLNEIQLNINLTNSYLYFDDDLIKLYNFIKNIQNKLNKNVLLKFNFKSKIYSYVRDSILDLHTETILKKYLEIVKLSKSNLFYLIISKINIINYINKNYDLNKIPNLKIMLYINNINIINLKYIPNLYYSYTLYSNNRYIIIFTYDELKKYITTYKNGEINYIYDKYKNTFISNKYIHLFGNIVKIPLIYQIIKFKNNPLYNDYISKINEIYNINNNKILQHQTKFILKYIVSMINIYLYNIYNPEMNFEQIHNKLQINTIVNRHIIIFKPLIKFNLTEYHNYVALITDIKRLKNIDNNIN